MKTIRTLYRMLWLMWLLTQMCYRIASNATNSAAAAHQRINGVITTVGGIHSGSVTAGMAEGLDVGNGAVSSLFTGSVSTGANAGTPPSQTSVTLPTSNWFNPASNTTVSQVVTNINGGLVTELNEIVTDIGNLRTYVNSFATTYNDTLTCIQYIQAELQAHNFSST